MMCTKHMIIFDEHRILFHLIVGTTSIIWDFQFFSSYIGWFSESTLAWSHLIQHPPNLNRWFNSPTVLECHSPGCSPKYTPCKYTENYRTLESESQKVLFFEMTNPLQTINLWFFVSFLSGVIRCIADPHSTSNSRKASDSDLRASLEVAVLAIAMQEILTGQAREIRDCRSFGFQWLWPVTHFLIQSN